MIGMSHEVARNDARSRYELVVDGELVGVADFVTDGSTVTIPHTEVTPSRRGEGLGALLVAGALDDIRARGAVVVPACWYVREYIALHPEAADLLAS